MASFGINTHAHIDAAVFAAVLTLLTYAVKWIFGFKFPVIIFFLPTAVAVFFGFYVILWVYFAITWSRK
jgi:hypothetical protein